MDKPTVAHPDNGAFIIQQLKEMSYGAIKDTEQP